MAATTTRQLIPTQIPSDFRMVSMLDAAYFEDLPAYTPRRTRDIDTLSIYSAAPSYRSEPPNYNDVEPLPRDSYYQDNSYFQETSFFDDEEDDIVLTELVVNQAQEQSMDEEAEPLTPTQSRVDAAVRQQSSLLYPEEPLTPTRSRPVLPSILPRRAVPPPTPRSPTPPLPRQSSLLDVEGPSQSDMTQVDEIIAEAMEEGGDDLETRGLPRMSWAPGFRPLDAFSSANYAFGNGLSNVNRNPVRKQYENVARRRVRFHDDPVVSNLIALASPTSESHPMYDLPELTREESPRNSRDNTPQPPSPRTPTAVSSSSTTTTSSSAFRPQSPTASPVSLRPQEDPELVGEVAAEQARKQREYRELMTTDAARALELESRGWDFMLSQSRDWEERQFHWASFRQTRMRKEKRKTGGFGGGLLRIVSRG